MMMKQFKLLAAAAILAVAVIWFPRLGFAQRGDIDGSVFQNGSTRGLDAWRVDSTSDFYLYNGDINLGAGGTVPSTTAGAYPGIKVPLVNSGTPVTQGMVAVANSTGTGQGFSLSVLSTTAVVGIWDGTYATGATGYITVGGYALVLTSGAVSAGDVIVSSNTGIGYAGRNTTPTSGTDIGVALGQGTAAGGLTLIRLR